MMIFAKMVLYFEPTHWNDLLFYVLAAIFFLVISYHSSLVITKIIPIRQDLPSFHLGNSFHNYGYLCYGLVANLLGEASMPKLFVFVITLEAMLWTWGVKLIRAQQKANWKNFVNPPAMAMALGICFKLLSTICWDQFAYWPNFVQVGNLSTPMALTALGVLLYHIGQHIHWREFKSIDLWSTIIFRHIFFPSLMCGLLLSALPFSEFRGILLIQAIMPMALMPLNIVAIYGGDKKSLGFAICTSMLLCTMTVPCWLIFLKSYILQ